MSSLIKLLEVVMYPTGFMTANYLFQAKSQGQKSFTCQIWLVLPAEMFVDDLHV